MYTDQTGRFPVQLYRGMQYIIVLFKLDTGVILIESMRGSQAGETKRVYQTLVDWLKERKIEPKLYILDNKYSSF